MSADEAYVRGVAAYYREKTAGILEKYGPGPRVHFHTGLVEEGEAREPSGDLDSIRASMARGQELLLEHVRDRSPSQIAGRILDVGCGLGGGALFWAAEPGVERVDAITIEPAHVELVGGFARDAGLANKVFPRLVDAHDVPTSERFEHVVAIESSCYLDRPRWAASVARALAPGGLVHIVDCFRAEQISLEWFDDYWRTRVGSLSEYQGALEAAGLAAITVENLAPRAWRFWDLSCAWIELTGAPGRAREAKLSAHRALQSALRTGALRYLRVTATNRR